MLPCCSSGTTKYSTEHVFQMTSEHSSFRRYLKAINIISVPITFPLLMSSFPLQASHPDVWPNSPAPLNMNHYANKKSAAESMLDVALLMANASQLKAVLEQGPNISFYTPIVTLISISLCLQVTVGVLLIFIGEKINTALSLLVHEKCLCCLSTFPCPLCFILSILSLRKIEAYHMPPFALQYTPTPTNVKSTDS